MVYHWASAKVPLSPKQQAIIEVARIVEPGGVGDQGGGERGQVEQLVPVGAVAGQA